MPLTRMSRKHLSVVALVALLRMRFEKMLEPRTGKPAISFADALMSAYVMFFLKDPSLLAFDARRHDENLQALFGIERVPSDTHMRTILDAVSPEDLRPAFQDIFRVVQRGKVLESFRYLDEGYLLCLDGTGYFSSSSIHCAHCLEKHHGDGTITYHHQMFGAALVCPDQPVVLPLMPEPIIKQDGATKNDCERNAARRFLGKFRKDHPQLPVVVVEDALSSNAPHVRDLRDHGMHFILGVKEGDHAYLFAEVCRREEQDAGVQWVTRLTDEPKLRHVFSIVRDVPLNEANPEVLVNFIRYLEYNEATATSRTFTWITDLRVTQANVWKVMRAGRAPGKSRTKRLTR